MPYEIREDSYLAHYGTLTYSGRYRWGSGEDPYQRLDKFLSETRKMKKEGFTEKEIAEAFGIPNGSTALRREITIAKYDKAYLDYVRAVNLKEQGHGYTEIARKMGWPPEKESQVRKILAPNYLKRQQKFELALKTLRDQVDKKEIVDVGFGVQEALKMKETEKNTLLRSLEKEGYNRYKIQEFRPGMKDPVNTMVLTKPDITFSEARKRRKEIQVFSGDLELVKETGNTDGFVPPKSLPKSKLQVIYADEGGDQADGLIYIRPGVKSVSLGGAEYAQVRIKVGDKHYLKGMAVYKDDLPPGIDVAFNTNKTRDTPIYGDKKSSILKPLKDDPENPFGTAIKRQIVEGKDENVKASSVVNLVNEEEDWDAWSRNLPAQFLSKQSIRLIRSQLEMTQNKRRDDLKDAMNLTNPVVKKHMLQKFADSADSAAEHLKATALAGQKTHVLIPVPTMKDNEVYAPNFDNGTRVALVRFPHAGNFEIPELIVNNNNKDAQKIFKTAPKAAIAINATVANQLSGADFDGDTVMVIPNNSGRIKARPPFEALKNFSPHDQYAEVDGMQLMKKKNVGTEMGKISNLITDMQLQDATDAEIINAVKHSMVVIDAEKHRLNYKQSEIDNRIAALKKKYQTGGASTIISRSKSQSKPIPEMALRPASKGGPIDKKTGELVYVPTNRTYIDKNGVEVQATMRPTKMSLVKDAHELSSGTKKEALYADHANTMKALANQARLETLKVPKLERNPEMAKKYAPEVQRLQEALDIAIANAPRERLAQRAAAARVAAVLEDNPDMSKDDLKKYRARALKTARKRVGAEKQRIYPSDREWEAIQAGAISEHKLKQILRHGDQERIVALATPKPSKSISTSKQTQIRSLLASGFTQAQVAERLGVSVSTVNMYA